MRDFTIYLSPAMLFIIYVEVFYKSFLDINGEVFSKIFRLGIKKFYLGSILSSSKFRISLNSGLWVDNMGLDLVICVYLEESFIFWYLIFLASRASSIVWLYGHMCPYIYSNKQFG